MEHELAYLRYLEKLGFKVRDLRATGNEEEASPEGLVDFFCLRKRIEGGEADKLSTADLIVHADAKLKFNHSSIEDLYQKWRSGQLSFDQVRKEYQALRRPETVTFIFSPVNGQVA